MAALAGYNALNLSMIREGHELLRQSLDASSAGGEEPNPYALIALALEALVTNRPDDSRNYSEEALTRARASREPYTEAECLSLCSITISMTSEGTEGLKLADEALDVARPLDSDWLLSLALEAAGIARYRTDPAAAVALLDESVIATYAAFAIHDQALHFKGVAHVILRQYGEAAQAFDSSLAVYHASGAKYYESMILAATARLLIRTGSTSSATQLLASLERLREDGRIVGAPHDLASQHQLRERLQGTLEPDEFADLWATGRRLTLDDAVRLARAELSRVAS